MLKLQWNVRRHLIERSDALYRWDRAYQYLLQLTRDGDPFLPAQDEGGGSTPVQQEGTYEHAVSGVRARLDAPASSSPDN
jgi:hypothetical protein